MGAINPETSAARSKSVVCLAIVKWLDAMMEGNWLDKAPAIDEELQIYSVGWLVYEGKDRVVLVQSLGDGHFGNVIHIPRGMVQSITRMELE